MKRFITLLLPLLLCTLAGSAASASGDILDRCAAKIKSAPSLYVTYTVSADGHSADGSSGIMDDGLFISLENSETSSINLYTKEPKTQFTGTLTTADFTGADVDGSSAEVVDASLNIESIDDYNVKVNGTVTLSISGNEFKVIFNDAPLYR